MKFYKLFALVISIPILLTSCANAVKPQIEVPTKTWIGNTLSNLKENGIFVQSEQSSFFTNEKKLYKSNLDGSNPKILCDDDAMYINVFEQWLYYLNSSNHKIYKIKTDGTERTKVIDNVLGPLIIHNNDLYYINAADDKIYRKAIDDQQTFKISDDKIEAFQISEKQIFFTSNGKSGIFQMNLDGSEKKQITKVNVYSFVVQDGWIYYSDNDKAYAFYRMKTDGSSITLISKQDCDSFNVVGNSIYYVDHSGSFELFKMNLDGSDKTSLSNNLLYESPYTWSINIFGDWIYYIVSNTDYGIDKLYRKKIDGTGEQLVKPLKVDNKDRYLNEDARYKKVRTSMRMYSFPYDESGPGPVPSKLSLKKKSNLYYKDYFKKQDGVVYCPFELTLPQFEDNGNVAIQKINQAFVIELNKLEKTRFDFYKECKLNFPNSYYVLFKPYYFFNNDKYLSVLSVHDGNTGGIRSWDTPVCDNFDMKTGKRLTLSDVMKMDSNACKEKIQSLLKVYFTNDPVYFEFINSNGLKNRLNSKHFFLNENAITVYYDIGEINSMASGNLFFEIPYELLELK